MDMFAIFGLQVFLSLLVWGLIGKWLFAPALENKTQNQALFWLTLPHAFRHIGMVFLVPAIVAPALPDDFASAAAYGDLISGFLAIASLFALRSGRTAALALVWIFNIVGAGDLLFALSHAGAVPHLGAAWYIPTFFVPLLLVTHFMIFLRLVKGKG